MADAGQAAAGNGGPLSGVRARVRRHLAGRAESEHEQALVRLAVVSLLVTYFGALAVAIPGTAPLTLGGVLVYGLGYLAIGAGYLAWIRVRPQPSPVRRVLGMVTDQTNVSVLIALGGAWGGAIYPIYLWITLGNGFRYGNAYLAAAAGYSAVTFGVAASLHPFWAGHVAMTAGLALGLIGLPAYGASLIRRLTEAKRAAEAANEAKSRFLATMSHELRTPLNAVIGLSEMLRDGRLDREQDDLARTINSSGRTLLALINDILDHAKIESGNARIETRDFDFAAEITNILAMMQPQARAKGLGLGAVVDAAVPRCVRGDPTCLRHILLNLLANALKFTDRGGAVLRVGATPHADGHELVVDVADTGIGIDPDNRARIFETFTQSEQHRGRRHEGSGLGLAIARQLAELLGGRLDVASTPGAGSTFTLTLPVAKATAAAATIDAGAVAPAPIAAAELAAGDAAGVPGIDLRGQTTNARPGPVTADGTVAVTDPGVDVPAAVAWRFGIAVRLPAPVRPEGRRAAAALLAALRDTPADAPGHATGADSAPASAAQPGTVLVVEDNAVNRKVTAKILDRAGHTAVTAESGDGALDRIETGGIDAVLMDVNMPGSSGLETTQLIRYIELGTSNRLPIIALTADATEATRNACADAGMDATIVKPVDPDTLLATLAAHLPDPAAHPAPAPEPATAAMRGGAAPGRTATPDAVGRTPVLDAHAVETLESLDSDGSFLRETVAIFLADAAELLATIRDALGRADAVAARDQLHALKSAAGNVGAARLRARVVDLDARLAAGETPGADDTVVRLRADIDAYRHAIAAHAPGAGESGDSLALLDATG